ncbi:component of the SPS plasma membrane amino acid sensor system [Saccharomyces cerevisiae YJM789]|uniref:SPS-sensor serine protease component SSY5 n=1 Tax=Saccharomyces cerevisiae (strain YJM789) TaxID=307796 RepID=SSY5_YEAS7|nr:RecName: Full=SPS-sensor serine protease component SSY5; AltName: Full=Endoprotease SSY5; Flags: Precursor [Saccharomyces cerevisiae YJM789]EDN63228.1 component of the SPS plasma membrane amino acid sensor system [Saccharomyces cerevisiae YJM789]
MVRFFGLNKKKNEEKENTDLPADNEQNAAETSSSNVSGNEERIDPNSHDANPENANNDDASTTFGSSIQSSSIFSRGRMTYGTGASSSMATSEMRSHSSGHSGSKNSKNLQGFKDVGKPLRAVSFLNPVKEEESQDTQNTLDVSSSTSSTLATSGNARENSFTSRRSITLEYIHKSLSELEENLVDIMDDIHQDVISISKAVIEAIEYFKEFLPTTRDRIPYRISLEKSSSLRKINKIVLHFLDNLLVSDAFSNSRSILLRRFYFFLKKLNLITDDDLISESGVLPCLSVFCIGSHCNLPSMDKLGMILDELTKMDSSIISDQEGAFIAPILRGITPKSSILTIMFGLPNLQHEHYEMIKVLYSLFPDVHMYCVKDYIKKAASAVGSIPSHTAATIDTIAPTKFQFSPPYAVSENPLELPISMSLSTETSAKITGTLGGYLFPQTGSDKKFSQFASCSFAITCAHVVLSEKQDYPNVMVPSNVLQTSYKKVLTKESDRYPDGSVEKTAFLEEVQRIDQNLNWQKSNKFGQVVWGERAIVDHRLSDFAIIKVNSSFKCQNTLGNGLKSFPDPTLRFQNLHVKRKIFKMKPGMKVFKIGASTGYTSGELNSTKLVYWADGKLQSSEFVVASPTPLFASAGDSGAWILTKLEDRLGLGLVGMLHSYDGEQRQFGLFTPIGDILERLHAVTKIQWDIDPQLDG